MGESLDLMTISAYLDEDFQSLIGKPCSVKINPNSLKRTYGIKNHATEDASKNSLIHQNSSNDILKFDVTIDHTGIPDQIQTNISGEITALKNLVYRYTGEIHRPNFVKLLWGKNMQFKGRLTSFDTSYTLFKPDGSPLKAKISLEFSSSTTLN